MRVLFTIDTKDYEINGKAFVRPSVRGIIIRNQKVGMVHSLNMITINSREAELNPMKTTLMPSFAK